MGGVGREVGLGEERARHCEPGLAVGAARVALAACDEDVAQADEALSRDRRRRAVHRLVIVEGLRAAGQVIAEMDEARRARVPVRHPVRRRVRDEEVRGRGRDLQESRERARLVPEAFERVLG